MTVMRDSLGRKVPKSAFVIRATELQMFLNCPRQWYILSHNGLNMEPATHLNRMFTGPAARISAHIINASKRTSNNWKAPGKTGMKGVTASGAPS